MDASGNRSSVDENVRLGETIERSQPWRMFPHSGSPFKHTHFCYTVGATHTPDAV